MTEYELVKKYLNDKRQDSTFSLNLLESLTFDERLASECEIALLCQKGNQQYFKYIPYFRIVNIEKVISPAVLELLSPEARMEALKNLFLKTGKNEYLSKLSTTALETPIAFNNLVNLSKDSRLPIETKERINKIVDKVYREKETDINYRIIAETKLVPNEDATVKRK